VQNAVGQVVGFSGRLIGEGDAPKYLNSPESPVFKKGALLFGLALSKNAIRQKGEAIVVEGNFDLLSLHDTGFTNAVAPLGTALTPEQALLLKRYTSKAILLYDSDEAGLKAAFRSGDELVARGFAVAVGFLPRGADPDTFVRHQGADALRGLLHASPDLIEPKLRVLRERLDLSAVPAKRRAIDLLLRSIRRIPDAITRELQATYVASQLGVEPALIIQQSDPGRGARDRSAVRGRSGYGAGKGSGGEAPPGHGPEEGHTDDPGAKGTATPKGPAAKDRVSFGERSLLLILVQRPDYLSRARTEIMPEDFSVSIYRGIYSLMLELGDDDAKGSTPHELLDRASPEMQSVLTDLMLSEWVEGFEEQIFQESVVGVKDRAKERELAESRREGKDLEDSFRLARERLALHDSRGRI
jgi:DNA primase